MISHEILEMCKVCGLLRSNTFMNQLIKYRLMLIFFIVKLFIVSNILKFVNNSRVIKLLGISKYCGQISL